MGVVSKLRLTSIGDAKGVVLPEEILARLKVGSGDELFLVDTPNGLLLTPHDPQLEVQLRAGRQFMAEYADVFRAWLSDRADMDRQARASFTARRKLGRIWRT